MSTAAFALVLLAFLLPFGTVSCGGEPVRVTGIELATFDVPGAARDRGGEPNLAQEVESGGGFLALVALLSAVAGLAMAAAGRGRWGLISVVGLAALIWLPYRAAAELADVRLQGGFVLAVCAFSIAGCTRVLERSLRRRAAGRGGWSHALVAAPLVLVSVVTAATWLAGEPPGGTTTSSGDETTWPTSPREGTALPMHSVVWASDGGPLAYVGSDGDFFGSDGLFVVAPDGKRPRRVIDGDVDDPVWAPRRRELAVVAREPAELPAQGDGEIMVVGLDGSEPRNLSRSPADDSGPAWSPDGERVVFSSARSGDYDLYSVRRDGRDLRRLTSHPAPETAPDWSPDGRSIVFRRSGDRESIVQIAVDGAGERVLLSIAPRAIVNACCWRPRWSPGGTRVAVDVGAQIRVIDVASGRNRVVAEGTGPLWSPDGARLLFDGLPPFGLSLVNVDGSGSYSLARRAGLPSVVTTGESWSSDGRTIAVVSDLLGERSIAIVRADGSGFRRLRLRHDASRG